VADLDGDGKADLAALNGRGLFRVLRGRDGATLWEMDAGKELAVETTMSSHSPVIADLDGDGRLDVFFVVGRARGDDWSENRGVAVCLSGFDGPARNADGSPAGWFMFRHDPQNTGNVRTELPKDLRRVLDRK
jgi:hypothetical protein